MLAHYVQRLEQLFGVFTYTSHQQISALEGVVDQMGKQLEVFDITGVGHMDTG